jgi:hypothetical protein
MTLLPLLLAAGCGGSAQAETISLNCEAGNNLGMPSPAMTMVYEGGDSGTLTVKSTFGEIKLPANRLTAPGKDDAGNPISVINLRASGPAKVLMPDKTAVEACAKGKLTPDQAKDKDIVFVTLLGCMATTAQGSAPVDVTASAAISLLDPPYVVFTRTYAEPGTLSDEPVKVEAYPDCSLVK